MSIDVTQSGASFDVKIDHQDLASSLAPYLAEALSDSVAEVVNERIDEQIQYYIDYQMDFASIVKDYVDVEDEVFRLLEGVGGDLLCRTGQAFKGAIESVFIYHLNIDDLIRDNLVESGKQIMVSFEIVNKCTPSPTPIPVESTNEKSISGFRP
ncbi:hypothetical protein CL620_00940 [archaeon]|nr:hypothetical protein [archaeon]|tara:strand:+ start:447 stop:908 length:462 start_codon:yes stop_codon:yes gene_type:complete